MTTTTTTETQTPLTVEQAEDLADDLIRCLAARLGDPEAVTNELRRWTDILGANRLALVCLAVVQTTFRECLPLVSREDWPTTGHTFIAPPREDDLP